MALRRSPFSRSHGADYAGQTRSSPNILDRSIKRTVRQAMARAGAIGCEPDDDSRAIEAAWVELFKASAEMWRGLAQLQRGAHRLALNNMAAELDMLASDFPQRACRRRTPLSGSTYCPLSRDAELFG